LNKRLDESLDSKALKKSLTGNSGVEIDLSKRVISPSGQVQPAASKPDSSGTSKGEASKGGA
jgi:hypothetical protein